MSTQETGKLSEKGMIVRIKTSGWSASKKDKAQTEIVRHNNGVSDGVVRVSKSLLPGCDKLETIRNCSSDLMKYVKKHSLPWDRGSYIIQAEQWSNFNEQVMRLRSRWNIAVQDFVQEYPNLVTRARNDLGPLFDETDYPEDPNDVLGKFSCDVNYRPVENGDDWRVGLNDEDIKALKESTEQVVKDQIGEAMKDVWRRVHDVVAHACKRLDALDGPENARGKPGFHESVILNAQELVDILPSLNMTDDEDLTRMGETLKDLLISQDPKQLKKDPDYRRYTRDRLMETKKEVEEFM